MRQPVDDYQQSKFYAESLKVCPWKDTDHMGERLHNFCNWCEGYVAGAEQGDESEVALRAELELWMKWYGDLIPFFLNIKGEWYFDGHQFSENHGTVRLNAKGSQVLNEQSERGNP